MAEALLEALTMADAASSRGDHAAAVAAFLAARALLPRDPQLALALANAYRLLGELLQERTTLEDALTHTDWRTPAVAHQLGAALLTAGAPQEAATCFALVLEHHPDDPAALAAVASALRQAGRALEAWPLARRAAQLAPRDGAVLLTAAQVRHEVGDLLGALSWLDKAERARPGHAATRVQRAYTSLLRAPSAAGWALFESRPLPVPATAARPWHGEPLAGTSILVTAEQGVGDQFQFLRYVRRLQAYGSTRVVVECHPDAVALLTQHGLTAVPRGAPPETDWHVPLLSLPHRLGVQQATDGEAVPYLSAPATQSLPLPVRPPGVLRLGLVWAGNPAFPGRITRDLDPALLPALLDAPGVQWLALQQGSAGQVGLPALHTLPPLGDWLATASVLATLDGLVTTDTGIAHLAGAMGVRTWVLLQHVPDWRWGLTGGMTPWYPSLTLVRQSRPGDWPGVITQLHTALAAVATASSD